MRELMQHTKNHASVIAWSLARRPDVNDPNSGPYLRYVSHYIVASASKCCVKATCHRVLH